MFLYMFFKILQTISNMKKKGKFHTLCSSKFLIFIMQPIIGEKFGKSLPCNGLKLWKLVIFTEPNKTYLKGASDKSKYDGFMLFHSWI